MTMKAFTDISQGKKLAEVLPMESADMRYDEYISYIDGTPKVGYKKGVTDGIPCWSLAALLDILPKNLDIGRPVLATNYRGYYWVSYFDEYMKEKNFTSKIYNNPIDACYEMIIKLHELNLL